MQESNGGGGTMAGNRDGEQRGFVGSFARFSIVSSGGSTFCMPLAESKLAAENCPAFGALIRAAVANNSATSSGTETYNDDFRPICTRARRAFPPAISCLATSTWRPRIAPGESNRGTLPLRTIAVLPFPGVRWRCRDRRNVGKATALEGHRTRNALAAPLGYSSASSLTGTRT